MVAAVSGGSTSGGGGLTPAGGAGAAGAAQAVTLATPDSSHAWVLESVIFGYSAVPAAGSTLTITDGVITEVYPVTLGGVNQLRWNNRKFSNGGPVVITLSAGGGAVVAYVWPYGWID